MKEVKLDTEHVLQTEDVYLWVTIGNAQVGGTHIELGFVPKVTGSEIKRFHLGKQAELVGEQLLVATIIRVRNQSTNHTSVVYELGDDENRRKYQLEHEVSAHGNKVYYEALFTFVRP